MREVDAAGTRGISILIVEDERVVARELQQTLRNVGYDVPAIASSADEALRLASAQRPDVVLMDIRLKGERDGIDAATLLRTEYDVPVIFLTAYSDDATVDRAKVAEPYGYLIKPIKDTELRIAIEIAVYKKEMETRLRVREHWVSTTLGSIADAVITVDRKGTITFMNRAAEELTQRSESQGVGQSVDETFRIIDERTREPVESALTLALREIGTVVLREPTTLLRPGGESLIEDSAAPIVDEKGALLGGVLVFRDVAARRQLERQAALSDRLTSLGTLAAGIAHEINNPLAAIVSTASHVAETVGALSSVADGPGTAPLERLVTVQHLIQKLPAALTDLTEGAERIRRIVADLRLFSSPQPEAPGPIELVGVLEWATRMSATVITPLARLVMDLGETPRVNASEVGLGQVFVNLMLNGAQAIAGGSPEKNEIRVATSTDSIGRAVVTIRDTGSGMSADVQKRIFEPFFTTKPLGEGTGLGLAICRKIVVSFGGTITVESRVGEGTTFRIVLPATRDAAPVSLPQAPAIPVPLRGRILVIDDDSLVLRAIIRTLGQAHDLTAVLGSAEALGVLETSRDFDLVLCDLIMPGRTGMDIHERVLESDPGLAERFVFLTGGAFTGRAAEYLLSVRTPRLDKPILPKKLREFVQEFLQERSRAPAAGG